MRISGTTTWRYVAIVAGLAGMMACSDSNDGGGGGPMVPSGTGPGPSGATITISNGSVSPSQVSITTGQSVTFISSDTRTHDIASDPHPAHMSCPSINAVGIIGNGQTKLTNSFPATGSCGFHDHSDENNNSLKGTITIR